MTTEETIKAFQSMIDDLEPIEMTDEQEKVNYDCR